VKVPGDKSISHRAAILNAIASGPAVIDNFLPADDCLVTLDCLQALGVELSLERGKRSASLLVEGRGLRGLREAAGVLDARNSGTSMRLLSGLLAGRPFLSILTGDRSLLSRPMGRIVAPLQQMGAHIWGRNGDARAPLAIRGGALRGIHYRMPVASAQVKSALLLAGLQAEGETRLEEPAPSRDHTERMLRTMGASLRMEEDVLGLSPLSRDLRPLSVRVPGDISAAAFWLVAGAVHPNAEIRLEGVGVNPTRTGIIEALHMMGADLRVENERETDGEPVADLTARSSRLRGVNIQGPLVVRLIDEVPVLAVAAALAQGRTVISDVAELRVKESDRIASTMEELRKLGARIEGSGDALVIEGVPALKGARCDSRRDHRLAMALAVAGLVAEGETVISGADAVGVSYPGFWDDLAALASSPANVVSPERG
jgi:3-phosphoshikimate 1-carboxyvinyltransferase